MKKLTSIFWLSKISAWLIRAMASTVQLEVIGEDMVKELKKTKTFEKRLIYAFWHGKMVLLIHHLQNQDITILVSQSQDGEFLSRILKSFGHRIIRGSSKRHAIRGTLELIKRMDEGFNIALAADGPQGPIYKVKAGIVYIAQKTGAYICPLTAAAKPAKIFPRAWDKFLLPLPFSKGVLIFGKPYTIHSEADIDEECWSLTEKLNTITRTADEIVKW